MALALITVSLLAISKAFPQTETTFEFFAYSDTIETISNLPSNYWDNIFDTLVDDWDARSVWGDFDWPAVEDNSNNLALIVNSGELKWGSTSLYETAQTLLNDFNPEVIQNHIVQYINSSIMFQVNGASQAIPGRLGPEYNFNFSCLATDPQKVYLTAKCLSRGNMDIWNGWDWRDIWDTYIVPNADRLSSGTLATGSSTGRHVITIFDYGYSSFDAFLSDYQYNNGDITADGITSTLNDNYPRLKNNQSINVWIECDVLTTVCMDQDYCQYSLPWIDCCFSNETCIVPTPSPVMTPAPITLQPTDAPTIPTNVLTQSPTADTQSPSMDEEITATTDEGNRIHTVYGLGLIMLLMLISHAL